MTDEALRHAVFLVTGSNLIGEQKDRPLAYFLKAQIDRYGGDDPGKCGIVVSDLWYAAADEVRDCPVISVGGPGVNMLSQQFWDDLPVALAVDNVMVIQMDVALEDLRAGVWGMDHESTREAVQTLYEKGYLRRFLEAAWDEKLQPLEQQDSKQDQQDTGPAKE